MIVTTLQMKMMMKMANWETGFNVVRRKCMQPSNIKLTARPAGYPTPFVKEVTVTLYRKVLNSIYKHLGLDISKCFENI